jgi:hypothetical protein
MFRSVLAATLFMIAITALENFAYGDPGVPRPLPCGMSSSPNGEWKLVTVGGGGRMLGKHQQRLVVHSIFPVWLDSVGGPSGAVCSELQSVSQLNVYEIGMVRYLAKPSLRAPVKGACAQAVRLPDISAHFTYFLRPGDWAAVQYGWAPREEGRAVVYVPRPGQDSADEAIAACVKITSQMNSEPDQLTGTLDF